MQQKNEGTRGRAGLNDMQADAVRRNLAVF